MHYPIMQFSLKIRIDIIIGLLKILDSVLVLEIYTIIEWCYCRELYEAIDLKHSFLLV